MNWTIAGAVVGAVFVLGAFGTGVRAPSGSAKRQLYFALSGIGVFFLAMLLLPDGNFWLQLAFVVVGAWSTISGWKGYLRLRRERQEQPQ